MPPRGFAPGSWPGGTAPNIIGYNPLAAQAIVNGSLVVLTAGLLNLCGANPASILGVALQAIDTNPGFNLPYQSQTTVITGRSSKIPVALARGITIFTCRGVNGGTDPVIPVQTDVGVSYDVVNTAGIWNLNTASTANARVTVVDIDVAERIFYVRFVAANVQTP